MDTIKIGGQDYPVKLRYVDLPYFIELNNFYYNKAAMAFEKVHGRWPDPESNDEITIENDFFFTVIWRCLKETEKGKKPFRNIKKMIEDLEFDEVQPIVEFIGVRILGKSEDKETKNVSH